MGKTKIIELTEENRQELENGWRNGASHAFRMRCYRSLLLKFFAVCVFSIIMHRI